MSGKDGSYENFWKALYWHLHGETPPHYQVIHTISIQLQTIQREIQKNHDEQHSILRSTLQTVNDLQTQLQVLQDQQRRIYEELRFFHKERKDISNEIKEIKDLCQKIYKNMQNMPEERGDIS